MRGWVKSLISLAILDVCAFKPCWAQSALAPKQLFIVKPGIDKLHGTWVSAVINKGGKPESIRVPVLLPRETQDFQPVEGVIPSDVRLEQDGVYVEKQFAPGVSILSFSFVVPASSGNSVLTLQTRDAIDELSVMTPRGMLLIRSDQLLSSGTDIQDLQTYDIWVSKSALQSGDTLSVDIRGVPEGRNRLWILGAAFGLTLGCAAFGLTWRAHRLSQPTSKFDMVL